MNQAAITRNRFLPAIAALLGAAIFFAPAAPANAQSQTDQAIDFAVEAFAYGGKFAGVDIGDTGKSLLKGAAKCAANNRPVLECARDEIINRLPAEARPVASCLARDLGNIDKNIGKCALEAAAPLISKELPPGTFECITNNPADIGKCALGAIIPKISSQLPPDVQNCLKNNLNDTAKCAADTAVKAAIDRAMANVPPQVRELAECAAKVENLPKCTGIPPEIREALNVAEKLKKDVNTASNILKVAEGIANEDWEKVLIHGGPEVYKAAAKIVLNALLTPALAPLIGPAVDLIVDNYTELAIGMINALKNKDEALAISIFAQFVMMEQVRPLCTVLAVIPGSAKEKACDAIKEVIRSLGDLGYAIFSCEAIKKGDVPIIGDIYQLGCGAANDAADIIWKGAEIIVGGVGKVGGAIGKGAAEVGGFIEDRFKDVEKTVDAIAKCKLDGILKDACDELGKAIETGGDIGRGVIKIPEKTVEIIGDAFADVFGGPDKRKGNNAECAGYAQRSVDQAKRNQAQACGFGGNAWGDNYQGHYNWCLTVRYTTVNKEARVRDEWLNKCAFCQGYQKTTEAQIQNAKDRGCIDQMRAGAANRWGDGTGHYTWCMSGGPRGPTNELGARNRDIASCRPTAPKPGTMPVIPPGSNITILCNDGRPPVPGQACPTPPPVNSHKRCPGINDRWFHTNEPCPPPPGVTIQCWDGSISDGFRPCPPRPAPTPTHVRCPDGSWAHPGQPCPQPRPVQPQVKTCPGGQVVPINANCPNLTRTCPGGIVVPITAQCPPQQPQMKACPGGQQVPVNAQCPPQQPQTKTCPGGAVVPINANCPNQTKTCPGGQTVPITAQCPPQTKTCPGGQVVAINAACPVTTKRCPSGAVVPANAACPAPPPKCRVVTERDCGGIRPPGAPPPVCKDVRKTVCDGPGPVVK